MSKYKFVSGVIFYESQNSCQVIKGELKISFYRDLEAWRIIFGKLSSIGLCEEYDKHVFEYHPNKIKYLEKQNLISDTEHNGIFKRQLEYFDAISTKGLKANVLLNNIADSNILIVGLGGIGSNLALGLAKSGFRNIDLLDHDRLEISNLNRSLTFNHQDQIGTFKTDIIRTQLEVLQLNIIGKNYHSKIEYIDISILERYDLILIAIDFNDIVREFILDNLKTSKIPFMCINYSLEFGQVIFNNVPAKNTLNLNKNYGSPSVLWNTLIITGFALSEIIKSYLKKENLREKNGRILINFSDLNITHLVD